DDALAGRALILHPDASDAIDHRHDVFGAAEVRHVEERSAARAAARGQPEPLTASAGIRNGVARGDLRAPCRRRAACLIRRLLDRRRWGFRRLRLTLRR